MIRFGGMAAGRSARRVLAFALMVGAVLSVSSLPAAAMELQGGCGPNGLPETGWDNHHDGFGIYTRVFRCNYSTFVDVHFNAKITQDDKDAGAFLWALAAGSDTILTASATDTVLLNPTKLLVGTELIGRATFKMGCDSGCHVYGLFVSNIHIERRSPANGVLVDASLPSGISKSTSTSGPVQLQLLSDAASGSGFVGLCNNLYIECTSDESRVTCSAEPRARSGESVATALTSDLPRFTPATTVEVGLEPGVEVQSLSYVSPTEMDAVFHVLPTTRPQRLDLVFYDATGAISAPTFVVDPNHWADHTLGNDVLTVTDLGSVGSLDPLHTLGAGFVYPRSGENQLNVGGFWLGTAGGPQFNRDYPMDPSPGWVPGTQPGDALSVVDFGPPRESFRGVFADAPVPSVRVSQLSRADSGSSYTYLTYQVSNQLGVPRSGLYAGLFCDFDVSPSGSLNVGGTDPARRLTWVSNGVDRYVGIRAIQVAGHANLLANASLIDNAVFVAPNQYILDADRDAFLRSADPPHHLASSAVPANYGALVSLGPLNVAAADSVPVVFAVVGGTSLAGLLANSDLAQARYATGTSGVDPGEPRASNPVSMLQVSPNPFGTQATISFVLARSGPLDLSVFDASGRRARRVEAGLLEAGAHLVHWDGLDDTGRAVPPGIYFVRANAANGTGVTRVVHMR